MVMVRLVLALALVAVRIEVVEAALHVREDAAAVVHQHHGVVFRLDAIRPLLSTVALGRHDGGHRHHRARRAEQAGQRGEVVDAEVGQAAAALLVEERRPRRAQMTVVRVRARHPPEPAVPERRRHEGELRAVDHRRRAPETKPSALGQIEQRAAFPVGVGHRLLAPDVPSRLQRLPVEPAVLLHVGQVDEQIERLAGQHLIDVRIVVRHAELRGPLLRPLVDDVARADELDVRRLRQMRKVLARDAAAANHADARRSALGLPQRFER